MSTDITVQDTSDGIDVTVTGGSARRTEEEIEDLVAALVGGGSNVTVTYDDANETLTIDTSALDTEEVEDTVDGLLTAGNAADLTYDDANGTLTVAVLDGSIDHDALLNYAANEHVDHSTVNITAGTSLTGGGDITASRTLNVDETTIAHDALSGFVANEHVDHSGVSITAGNGLIGGGDLTASRTLDAHDVSTQTANYTAAENDIVLADASGGALTVTLPAPSESVRVSVKKTDASANAVTISTPGTETIDGDTDRTLTAQYVAREIVSDGTDYYVI